jgi:hypothetical protein
MMRPRATLAAVVLAACHHKPAAPPTPTHVVQELKDQVDLLFVFGNEPSTSQLRNELNRRFPELVKGWDALAYEGFPVSLHLGAVTSDLGAGTFTLGSGGQCHPGGDGGVMHARGRSADPVCQPLLDGKSFVTLDLRNGTNNLPTSQNLPTTFGCMSAVSGGCGFIQPLEAARKALVDPIAENAGFLRPDALLAIVYLTDEEDCSIDPASDLFDPTATDRYGPLHHFRCARFGIACDGGLLPDFGSLGTLSGCHPAIAAEGARLLDVQRYIDTFTRPLAQGGLKADPSDVVVLSIAAPPSPLAVRLSTPCADALLPSCALEAHSCVSPGDPNFFGDPGVRVSAVTRAVPDHLEWSLCDGDYTTPMIELGDRLAAKLTSFCLSAPVADPAAPDCVVEDIADDGTPRPIPACAQSGDVAPCWSAAESAACAPIDNPRAGRAQQTRITITRAGMPRVEASTTRLDCVTRP